MQILGRKYNILRLLAEYQQFRNTNIDFGELLHCSEYMCMHCSRYWKCNQTYSQEANKLARRQINDFYCVSEVIEMGIKCYLNQEKGVFHNMKRWRKISQVRWLLICALVECTRPKIGTLWRQLVVGKT